jgi:hypothetical protein
MRKHSKAWNIVLMMASVASGLLIIPPEAKAEMIASRMQSGKVLELVRQQLGCEIMQQQMQRFGLSQAEARQIQTVFGDARVVEEMVRLQRLAHHPRGGQAARGSRTTSIQQNISSSLLTALQSSVDAHMGADLQQKLSKRARGVFGDEKLIASRLSGDNGAVDARKALAEARRMLTAEKLVALGMTEIDAGQTVAKLKDSDIDRIFEGDLQIGYAAGLDLMSGAGLLLLLVIILGIAAIIAGGAVTVVFIVVAVIAMVYFLAHDW